MSAEVYFLSPPWDNLAYCSPVGDVGMWVYHRDLMVFFASSYLSELTLALNTW